MNKANELSKEIVRLMTQSGMSIETVHDELTSDSVVEHVTDLDVETNGCTYNVRLTIIRFSTN